MGLLLLCALFVISLGGSDARVRFSNISIEQTNTMLNAYSAENHDSAFRDFEKDGERGFYRVSFLDKETTTQWGLIALTFHDCSVSTCYEEFEAFLESTAQKQLWKKNIMHLERDYRVFDNDTNYWVKRYNLGHPIDNSKFKFLKSSKESDYSFLPVRLSHFQDIQKFYPVQRLYDDYPRYISLPVRIHRSCLEEQADHLQEVLTLFYVHINDVVMNYLESRGNVTSEERLDSACHAVFADEKSRPGVPFRLTECCEFGERNMFEEEKEQNEHHSVTIPKQIECHMPSGSVYVIRRWTLILMALLLLLLPLLITCFPSRPEPYKVLRDTTRRGHKLYHRTENDRQICLADAGSGKIVEINAEENLVQGFKFKPLNGTKSLKEEEEQTKSVDFDEDQLPAIVKEGKDFRNEIPDRLYLDSDPEFHLNMNIIVSYVLLFHVDSHILMVLRRIIAIYITWMISGMGFFIYLTYYPILLNEPILNLQFHLFGEYLYNRIMKTDGAFVTYTFMSFILPTICAVVTLIFLSPILLRKRTISETLHCNGNLSFFGDPFPEYIVEMKLLRRTPKPSKPWTYEQLVFRNMIARLKNLTKREFWKLLWHRWICRGLKFKGPAKDKDKAGVCDILLTVFWLPLCVILLILHVVPIFSLWANYVWLKATEAFGRPCNSISIARRIVSIVLFFMQLIGILIFYLMVWNLLVILGQFVVFVCIDILRNATTTLSKIILFLGITMYIRSAFQDFEEGYRELKSVTFALCIERHEANEDGDTTVVVKQQPCEPLYVQTVDGESSIPRRVFYEVCRAYRPFARAVVATLGRLSVTFALIIVIFVLIIKFNIFSEFTEVGEPLLTAATVTLPLILGISKSATHQELSDQRRDIHIRTWLKKITTRRKVNVNLNKPTKRVVSTC